MNAEKQRLLLLKFVALWCTLFEFRNCSAAADVPLTYSEVFGSSQVLASAVDSAGNVWLAGSTRNANFPVTADALQPVWVNSACAYVPGPNGTPGTYTLCDHGFVAKVDPSGTRLLYASYLGGNQQDSVAAMAVDGSGSVYITGFTSSDLPTTPGAYLTSGSGFVAKLTPDGSHLEFSTRIPAPGKAIAVDSGGNVYVAGAGGGADFPTTPGAFQREPSGNTDAFVMELNSNGTAVQYSTLIGGTFADWVNSIAVDSAGNAYIAGVTASTPYFSFLAGPDYALFPTTPGAYSHPGRGADVFIAKLNSDGSELVYSSVFGGSGDDVIYAIAIDASGAVYFAGGTPFSPDFPVTPEAVQKTYGGGFVGKLSPDGSQLVYSTYLGTGRFDEILKIGANDHGHVFVSGTVNHPNLQTTPNADLPCFNHLLYAELNDSGSELIYSTYANSFVSFDSTGSFYTSSSSAILRRVDTSISLPNTGCAANRSI